MTPLERGERAKQLLGDAVLQQALSDIRDRIVGQLESSAFGDVDTHHHAAIALQCLKQVTEQLTRYSQEIAVDEHKKRQIEFMSRMKQTLRI